MLTFTVHFALDSLCFFCHLSLTCFDQALNTICFIIGINVLKIDENRCKQTEINLSLLWVLQVIESIPYLVQIIGH